MMYLITNRHLVSKNRYYEVLKNLSILGLERIILREKDLQTKELEKIYYNIKAVIQDHTKIIINSDVALARKVKGYGVQLSFRDFIQYKKGNSEDDFIIGVSIHTLEEAIFAEKLGASYILASNIYETKCKEGLKGKGTEFIRQIKRRTNIKVIALGGITTKNINEVLNAKADGIAVMSALMESENIEKDFKKFNYI